MRDLRASSSAKCHGSVGRREGSIWDDDGDPSTDGVAVTNCSAWRCDTSQSAWASMVLFRRPPGGNVGAPRCALIAATNAMPIS